MKFFSATRLTLPIILLSSLASSNALAREVGLTETRSFAEVMHNGHLVTIERIQNTEHRLTGGFTKTSRKCPPFCIQPMKIADGVTTVAEAEIFEFMEKKVAGGLGVIVDARTPAWYRKGTIPGSINIPFTVFEADDDDPDLIDAMKRLRAKRRDDVGSATRAVESALGSVGLFGADKKTENWDFTAARDVLLYCNGPWCGQSPHAIRALLAKGYPAEKLYYYRGGMQMWQILGLTVIRPDGGQVANR